MDKTKFVQPIQTSIKKLQAETAELNLKVQALTEIIGDMKEHEIDAVVPNGFDLQARIETLEQVIWGNDE